MFVVKLDFVSSKSFSVLLSLFVLVTTLFLLFLLLIVLFGLLSPLSCPSFFLDFIDDFVSSFLLEALDAFGFDFDLGLSLIYLN